MVSLKALRSECINILRQSGAEEPTADTSLILKHVTGADKTALVLGTMDIDSATADKVYEYISRVAKGEPVQYVINSQEFMSLDFYVKSGVLIPRQDTEVLAEEVIRRLDGIDSPTVIDIGCGSGCIGISLARYLKTARVISVDTSPIAIEVTQLNAERLNVSDRLKTLQLDIMKAGLPLEADCIVSNPPYIRRDVIEALSPKVKDYEPAAALDGGVDGLDFYRRIAECSRLKPDGILAFETGYDQGEQVKEIMEPSYRDVEIICDIEGRQRVVLGYKNC